MPNFSANFNIRTSFVFAFDNITIFWLSKSRKVWQAKKLTKSFYDFVQTADKGTDHEKRKI